MVRDFSSWLWSGYNFWCAPGYDDGCSATNGFWVNASLHSRSPELFHDIVINDKVAGANPLSVDYRPGNSPLRLGGKTACGAAKDNFRLHYEASVLAFTQGVANRDLSGASTNSKVVLLASEKFQNVSESFRLQLQRQTGLRVSLESVRLFNKERVNTQSSTTFRGTHSIVSADSFQEGLYAASNFKPMLRQTVNFLHKCWETDCEWTSRMTGYNYKCTQTGANGHNRGNSSVV